MEPVFNALNDRQRVHGRALKINRLRRSFSERFVDKIEKLIRAEIQRRAGYAVVKRGTEMECEAELIDVCFDALVRSAIERRHEQYRFGAEHRQRGGGRGNRADDWQPGRVGNFRFYSRD